MWLKGTVQAMPRFAALLRGIAPSGVNMTNEKLRAVFEGLGLDDVASVLASGNIVFRTDVTDAPLLEQRIEDALADQLGISCATRVAPGHRSAGGVWICRSPCVFPPGGGATSE